MQTTFSLRFLALGAATAAVTLLGACQSLTMGMGTHNARNSLDWAGSYVSPGDCPACMDILTLDAQGEYHWQGQREGRPTQLRQGLFSWDAQGQNIALSSTAAERFFVAENGLRSGSRWAPRQWRKVEVLQDALGTVLVDAASIDRSNPAALRLQVIENWNAPQQVQARSLAAHYSLNCLKGSYSMTQADYHEGLWAQGARIPTAPAAPEVSIAVGAADARMRQLFARYCPAIAPPAPAPQASQTTPQP